MKAHDVNWVPWSEWITVVGDVFLDSPALLIASRTNAVLTAAVDGPTDHLARVEVKHDAAIELPLAGWVLGDVGQPQLIGSGGGELALDQVLTGPCVLEVLVALFGPGRPGTPSSFMIRRTSLVLTMSPCSSSKAALTRKMP